MLEHDYQTAKYEIFDVFIFHQHVIN